MTYNITVKEFIKQSKSGSIDYSDFSAKVAEQAKKINQNLHPLREIVPLQPNSQKSSLFGLPISFKDAICTKDIGSFAGAKILEGYKPPFDATAVKRIKEQSGAILGKTNQDSFGFGTFCVNSDYGIPKNPHDTERTAGGSSGGAACLASASTFPHIAIGESTGGSISAPSAFCGVYGLTPTYGLVSRYGLIDYSNSMDKIGIMSKQTWDIAHMLSIIAGNDKLDSTSLPEKPQDYTQFLNQDIKGLKIGVPKEYQASDEIQKSIWNSIKKLESLGATYEEVSLPHTKYALSAYYIIATSEASTNLAKYCGLRYGIEDNPESKGFNEYYTKIRTENLNEESKRRIILGTFARMSGYRDAYYLKAMKVRTLIINDFKQAFKKVDILAAPTMPILPPKFKEIEQLTPLQHYQMDVLTVPSNLAGIPMISVPANPVKGLPVGLHLMADHLNESKLIQTASALEVD